MSTKTVEKTEAKAAEKPARREMPLVVRDHVQIHAAGKFWRHWRVVWPEGGTLDDLKEPGIWKRVQAHASTALLPLDEVRIIAFDRAWIADAIVAHASMSEVVLTKPNVTPMPERRENLYQDDRYAVRFVGLGYAVFRKSDSQRMSDIVTTAALAERDLVRLYPVAAA